MPHHNDLLTKLSDCIVACQNCSDACLDEKDISAMTTCIRTDRDCAEVCQMTLNFIARNSGNAEDLIQLCAEICASCASECEQHSAQHCKDCAAACRACEEACRDFLA